MTATTSGRVIAACEVIAALTPAIVGAILISLGTLKTPITWWGVLLVSFGIGALIGIVIKRLLKRSITKQLTTDH